MKLWYDEVDGDLLILWEGVFGLVDKTKNRTTLLKLSRDRKFIEHLRLPKAYRLTSEGYWCCVEITGRLNELPFYYCFSTNFGLDFILAKRSFFKFF